jgi:hypothetical protein
MLADSRDVFQRCQNQPCDRDIIVFREGQMVPLIEFCDRHIPWHTQMAFSSRLHEFSHLILVKLIENFPHNFLDEVFQRDQSKSTTVFIHHNRNVGVTLLQSFH